MKKVRNVYQKYNFFSKFKNISFVYNKYSELQKEWEPHLIRLWSARPHFIIAFINYVCHSGSLVSPIIVTQLRAKSSRHCSTKVALFQHKQYETIVQHISDDSVKRGKLFMGEGKKYFKYFCNSIFVKPCVFPKRQFTL